MHTILLIAACLWTTSIVFGAILCGLISLDQWRQDRGYPSFGMIAPDPYEPPVPSIEQIADAYALNQEG